MKRLLCFCCCLFHLHSYSQQVTLNTENAFNGYTLFAPLNSTDTYLIDNCGYIINSWESNYTPGLVVYLTDDGSLMRTCKTSTEAKGGRVEKYDWNGNLTWAFDFCDLEH